VSIQVITLIHVTVIRSKSRSPHAVVASTLGQSIRQRQTAGLVEQWLGVMT